MGLRVAFAGPVYLTSSCCSQVTSSKNTLSQWDACICAADELILQKDAVDISGSFCRVCQGINSLRRASCLRRAHSKMRYAWQGSHRANEPRSHRVTKKRSHSCRGTAAESQPSGHNAKAMWATKPQPHSHSRTAAILTAS